MCRMSAYDNVDDRSPRAPPSETSEQTEFSEPWAESIHGMCSESGHQVSELDKKKLRNWHAEKEPPLSYS